MPNQVQQKNLGTQAMFTGGAQRVSVPVKPAKSNSQVFFQQFHSGSESGPEPTELEQTLNFTFNAV